MPKDRRSPSFDRCRVSPYSRNFQGDRKTRPRTPSLPIGNENEWEETRCPICMEHPHNAVLLLCSSREKGCRPYMCSTSSRHSNCLDQFRKSSMNADTSQEVNGGEETKLVCPLCRGQVNGWIVVKPARQFMDSKVRSCSLGTCDFSGNYSQLRKHARYQHPNDRPTDVDPERELEWRKLEDDLTRRDMLTMQYDYDYDDYVDGDDDDDDNDDDDDDDYAIEESVGGGLPDLNLSIEWDHDYSFSLHLIRSEIEEFDIPDSTLSLDENLYSDFDFASGPVLTHNRLPVSSRENELTNSYNRLSSGPRENGMSYSHNRLPERSREYGLFNTNTRLSERPRAYGQTDTHNMLSGRTSRYVPSDGHNRLSEGARGYGLNTRSRSNTHRRRSSRNANRAEQLSTIVEFHDLSSNRR